MGMIKSDGGQRAISPSLRREICLDNQADVEQQLSFSVGELSMIPASLAASKI